MDGLRTYCGLFADWGHRDPQLLAAGLQAPDRLPLRG